MQVISNYPQVPIATSNPATDVARTENLQRPPVIPPQQSTSNHEERALNSQNERANVSTQQQAMLADTVHEKQQSNQQQQQEQEQGSQQQRKQLPSREQLLQLIMANKPALDRRDIRNRVATVATPAASNNNSKSTETKSTSSEQRPQGFYREFGARISHFYQARSEPIQESELSASA